MKKINTYILYIKSHCDCPDYEQEVEASSKDEAAEYFYKHLKGEYDKDFIKRRLFKLGI